MQSPALSGFLEQSSPSALKAQALSNPQHFPASWHNYFPQHKTRPSTVNPASSPVIQLQAKSPASVLGQPSLHGHQLSIDSAAFLAALITTRQPPTRIGISTRGNLPRGRWCVTSYKSFARTPFWQPGVRPSHLETVNSPKQADCCPWQRCEIDFIVLYKQLH